MLISIQPDWCVFEINDPNNPYQVTNGERGSTPFFSSNLKTIIPMFLNLFTFERHSKSMIIPKFWVVCSSNSTNIDYKTAFFLNSDFQRSSQISNILNLLLLNKTKQSWQEILFLGSNGQEKSTHLPSPPPQKKKIQQWLHEANLCLYINFSCFLFVFISYWKALVVKTWSVTINFI